MTAQHIIETEKSIDQLVQKSYRDPLDKAAPILDGAVDAELYLKSPIKILWILKEPWCGQDEKGDATGGDWNLRELMKSETLSLIRKSTLAGVYYITYAVLNGIRDWDSIPYAKDAPDASARAFQSIAFINAKKLPGRRHGANDDVVLEWYEKCKGIIKRQIDLYAPDVIFGCRPHMQKIVEDFGGKDVVIQTSGHASYCKIKNILFVAGYHPGQTTIQGKRILICPTNVLCMFTPGLFFYT